MNIKTQYSIRDFGTPSVFSGTNILNISSNGYWVINGIETNISANRNVPESSTNIWPEQDGELALYHGAGTAIFQRNLELLNQRINAVHKQLTYWDLYKLTSSVDNAEDLESTFAGLSVGQSMVINCPTFSTGGVQYSRGDVIVKTSDNEEILIKALATGLFYPSKIEKQNEEGNVFNISFNYFNGEPLPNTSQEINIGETVNTDNGLPSSIIINNLSDTPGNVYGYYYPINNIQDFDVLYENGTGPEYIRPIVKVFTAANEEMSLDSRALSISVIGSFPEQKWHITVNALGAAYIQVK